MVLNGTGLFFLTPVSPVPLYQTSFLTSINQSSDHQFIMKGSNFLQEKMIQSWHHFQIMQGSWFRLLSYKKEIMVCNDTGLIVRYIPFSPVRWVEIWGLSQNTLDWINKR
ncbi:Bifunctional autolysin [Trichinella spiralis]|uniref:Bifunctional autolysin n=1 Tax=Trichinella spiralis TaxID=6334 RepID=A0ABR3KBY2_TRISP